MPMPTEIKPEEVSFRLLEGEEYFTIVTSTGEITLTQQIDWFIVGFCISINQKMNVIKHTF